VSGLDDGFITAVLVFLVLLTLLIAYLILSSVLGPFFGWG
jgi:phage shock protein PspC (stress-responsive transcriptional regulator)